MSHGEHANLSDLGDYLIDGLDTLERLRFVNIDSLASSLADPPVPVAGAPGVRAIPLLRVSVDEATGHHGTSPLGVDLLKVPAGVSFPPHVHAGHHLLYCVRGAGTFTYDGETIPVAPGDLYLALANVPHAVGAGDDDDHWLLSFGAPHRHVGAEDRMTILDPADVQLPERDPRA